MKSKTSKVIGYIIAYAILAWILFGIALIGIALTKFLWRLAF